MPRYQIEIHTGSATPSSFARTFANVYLILLGTRASSRELLLESTGTRFGRSSVDTFSTEIPDLGDIRRLCVRHDNPGIGPGWFLERIVVRNDGSSRTWTFPCHRWLARHEDDGQIERILDVG